MACRLSTPLHTHRHWCQYFSLARVACRLSTPLHTHHQWRKSFSQWRNDSQGKVNSSLNTYFKGRASYTGGNVYPTVRSTTPTTTPTVGLTPTTPTTTPTTQKLKKGDKCTAVDAEAPENKDRCDIGLYCHCDDEDYKSCKCKQSHYIWYEKGQEKFLKNANIGDKCYIDMYNYTIPGKVMRKDNCTKDLYGAAYKESPIVCCDARKN